jgi:hypothetical protein
MEKRDRYPRAAGARRLSPTLARADDPTTLRGTTDPSPSAAVPPVTKASTPTPAATNRAVADETLEY